MICGGPPEKFTADAGYYSDEYAEFCEERGVDAYISTGRESISRKAGAGSRGQDLRGGIRSAIKQRL
jgi:hypothetical protein